MVRVVLVVILMVNLGLVVVVLQVLRWSLTEGKMGIAEDGVGNAYALHAPFRASQDRVGEVGASIVLLPVPVAHYQ